MSKENVYVALRGKHQKRFNEFPMFFAFDEQGLINGMKLLGVDGKKDLVRIGANGFITKNDVDEFLKMTGQSTNEMKAHIENDKTGEGFIFDMFYEELANHEYVISGELEPTLEALGLTEQDFKENKALETGLYLAVGKYLNDVNLNQ